MTALAVRPVVHTLAALRDLHHGEDAYVIGSGATLDFLDPLFFDGRLTIGCNLVSTVWSQTRYTVTKYHEVARTVADAVPWSTVVVSSHLHGNLGERTIGEIPDNVVPFDHLHNRGHEFDPVRDWPTDPDQLVVSWSTITSALHFAAYLGVRNIILVGHDCGLLDGRAHVLGYPVPENRGQWLPEPDEEVWLARIEQDSLGVRGQLIRRYGVRVYSLSPFLSYRRDGVSFG